MSSYSLITSFCKKEPTQFSSPLHWLVFIRVCISMIDFLAVQNAEIVVIDQFRDWDMISWLRYHWGVPRGSVLSPMLYLLYTSPLGHIVREHGLLFRFTFMLTTRSFIHLLLVMTPDLVAAKQHFENCVADINLWITTNKLKLNNDKSEFLFLHSRFRHLPINRQVKESCIVLLVQYSKFIMSSWRGPLGKLDWALGRFPHYYYSKTAKLFKLLIWQSCIIAIRINKHSSVQKQQRGECFVVCFSCLTHGVPLGLWACDYSPIDLLKFSLHVVSNIVKPFQWRQPFSASEMNWNLRSSKNHQYLLSGTNFKV